MAAEFAIVNAAIQTMDPKNPVASAIAWSGDHIIAIGDDASVREAIDGATNVVDAHGAAVTPGIVDGHQHHVCVGTHLFYLTAERFDVSRLVMVQDFDLYWSEDFVGRWSMMETSTNRDRLGDVPLRSAGPERSVLCVYRI